MAAFSALVTGGCGDGGGTAVSKFASTFLANQQLHADGQQRLGLGLDGVGLADVDGQLELPLLGEERGAGVLHDGTAASLEAEFLHDFHPEQQQLLFESEWQQQQQTGMGAEAVRYVLDALADGLARGSLQLPGVVVAHPQALSAPEKLDAVRQVSALLSERVADQALFDAYLGAAVRALCIEPELVEEAALQDEWEAAVQQQQQVGDGALEQDWAAAQQAAAEHEALLEQQFAQHFDPAAQQAAAWQHELEEQAEMEAAYEQAEQQAQAQQWADELLQHDEPLTAEQLLRKEEQEWYAQFVVGGPPTAEAASWIDEFVGGPPAHDVDALVDEFLAAEQGSAGAAAHARAAFNDSVRSIADNIGSVVDPHVRNSQFLSFLRGVADNTIDIDSLPNPEQSFFPA